MRATTLPEGVWRERRAAHEARVDGWLAGHLRRRGRGVAHPVEDFLFTYYSYRPAQLRRWHPGPGAVLEGCPADVLGVEYVDLADGATLDTDAVLTRRRDSVTGIDQLLAGTAARAAHLGCYGMHEWAMVYGRSRRRPPPRRAPPPARSGPPRWFGERSGAATSTRSASSPHRPCRSTSSPDPEHSARAEQPGCIHANMDLYRWCYKLPPLVLSDLLWDCFALAVELRDARHAGRPVRPTRLSASSRSRWRWLKDGTSTRGVSGT